MERQPCHYCHIVLTFPEQQSATIIQIKDGDDLYFHSSCYILFLRFIYSVLNRVLKNFEIDYNFPEGSNNFFQAQKSTQEIIDRVLEKFKYHRFSARAKKIYDLWILATGYLGFQPKVRKEIRDGVQEYLESLKKIKNQIGPP